MDHKKNETDLVTEEESTLICADCNLPLAGSHARTNVTRYLAETSRCQCANLKRTANDKPAAEPEKQPGLSAARVKVGLSLEDAREILKEKFEVESFLGKGGMGSVFKAKENLSKKVFAVKLLNPQLINDELSVKRFEQEAKACMHLTHPHLTAVYEYGLAADGTPYIVMDYLEGKTLDELINEKNYLDHMQAVDLFIQICEGMQEAHSKGVIHRDIKPNNIMITNPAAGLDFAKLFDFGIAKVLPDQQIDYTSDLTQSSDLFGSPAYMSPEQCRGLVLDQRSDIYSFGCVMYKTLTGSHPFEGKNFIDTVVKIITTEPQALKDANSRIHLPANLEKVVLRCIAPDREHRYKTASMLRFDLERVRDGKPVSEFESEKTAKKPKRTKPQASATPALIIGSALIALAGGLIFLAPNRNAPAVNSGSKNQVPIDPYSDAERLDSLSYTYFSQGKYEQAIPLLEFGIKTYKENGLTKIGRGREDNYLAENYSHLGKCYLMLKRYTEAVPSYKEALRIFRKWGNYPGGMMTEAVNDYALVLKEMGKSAMADAMLADYSKNNNLSSIPDPTD